MNTSSSHHYASSCSTSMTDGDNNSQSFYVLVPGAMSRRRVVQDSDDEDASDVATSIDPLQEDDDTNMNNSTNPQTRTGSVDAHPSLVSTTGDAESELLQVDFDRFLQSDDNEIGLHTMNFGPVEAVEERAPFVMPSTHSVEYMGFNGSSGDLNQVTDDLEERQAKRRRISPENGKEWWSLSSEKPGTSYNFFESFQPQHTGAADTGHSQLRSQEQFDTPPPTVPFSEASPELAPGPSPVSKIISITPLSADAHSLSNRNRSVVKQQEQTGERGKRTDRGAPEETATRTEKQSVKRRGRQEKQADDDAPEAATPPAIPTEEEGKAPSPAGTESNKPAKKSKAKRSKTTSDIPDAETKNVARGTEKDVIWIDSDEDASASTTRQSDSSATEPKTQGRKKKKKKEKESTPKPSTDAGAAPKPNTTVLQDIPNTPPKKTPLSDTTAQVEKTPDGSLENRPQVELSPSPDPLAEPAPPLLDSARKVPSRNPGSFTITSKVPYRVGLSRKVRVAPLLKVVRK